MNKNNPNPIKVIFIFYISIFLITGCSTFYKVDQDEINEIDKSDVVQIVFKNGEKLKMQNISNINYSNNNEIEFISYSDIINKTDSTSVVYSLESIKEIRVEKFDTQKTVFTTLWMTMGLLLAFFIFLELNGESFSLGG